LPVYASIQNLTGPKSQNLGDIFKCSKCGNIFEYTNAVFHRFKSSLSEVPLRHGGFDLEGENLSEILRDLRAKTDEYYEKDPKNSFPLKGDF